MYIRYRIIYLFLLLGLFSCKKKNAEQIITELPYYNNAHFTPTWSAHTNHLAEGFHQIPSFRLTDQNGQPFSDKNLKGKIYVSSFFFTTCSGICRQLTLNMKTLSEAFSNNDNIQFVMHSVTPDIDQPEILKKYLDRYEIANQEQWHLLTGNKKTIYDLAREAYFSDESYNKTQQTSDFIHTENFLLIDQNKRIRGVYNGTLKLEIKKMIKHIELLLKES